MTYPTHECVAREIVVGWERSRDGVTLGDDEREPLIDAIARALAAQQQEIELAHAEIKRLQPWVASYREASEEIERLQQWIQDHGAHCSQSPDAMTLRGQRDDALIELRKVEAEVRELREALDRFVTLRLDDDVCFDDGKTCRAALDTAGTIHHEGRCAQARAALGAQQPRACPCLHTDPCDPRCTCVNPISSRGCARCCTYGSAEQQKANAERLAAQQQEIERLRQSLSREVETGNLLAKSVEELDDRCLKAEAALAAREAEVRDLKALLEDIAARWHSVAHEKHTGGDEYNPAAIALCKTERCRTVIAALAGETRRAGVPGEH